MTPDEAARRLLMDAPGEPLCVACLSGVIGTTYADMQGIVEALLADAAFQRGWTCGSCSRARVTVAYIRKCAHCSAPVDSADTAAQMGGDLFHVVCLRRLFTDDTIRFSNALSQRSRELIEQSRRRLRSPNAVLRPRRPPSAMEEPPPRQRRRVLIVDDNEDNRDMYAYYLEHVGWHVEVASDAETAIATARSAPFTIIIMDISMPGMDGAEATRQLKADPRTRAIPVLIVTGHALGGLADAAMAAGADGYCLKPCPPETLEEEMAHILARAPREA